MKQPSKQMKLIYQRKCGVRLIWVLTKVIILWNRTNIAVFFPRSCDFKNLLKNPCRASPDRYSLNITDKLGSLPFTTLFLTGYTVHINWVISMVDFENIFAPWRKQHFENVNLQHHLAVIKASSETGRVIDTDKRRYPTKIFLKRF